MDLLIALQQAAVLTQGAVKEAVAVIPPDQTANALSTQLVLSIAGSYLLEWLKRSKWFPLLSSKTTWLAQVAWSAAVAAATSFGVHAAYSYDATAGTLAIQVTGLGWQMVEHGINFLNSFVVQQLTHDVALDRRVPPTMVQPSPGEEK